MIPTYCNESEREKLPRVKNSIDAIGGQRIQIVPSRMPNSTNCLFDYDVLSTDREEQMRLIETCFPIIWFHEKESYFPCDARDYILGCALLYKDEVILEPILDPLDIVGEGNGLSADHNARLKSNTTDKDYRLVRRSSKTGNKFAISGNESDRDPSYKNKPTVMVYCNFIKDNHHKFIDIVYFFTYAYNGTRSPHDFDLEAVVVRFDAGRNTIDSSFLSVHGLWSHHVREEIEFESDNRPVFYAANESHCFQPAVGKYYRLFNLGTDYTSRGYRWDPLTSHYDRSLGNPGPAYHLLPTEMAQLDTEWKWILYVGERGQRTSQNFNIYQEQKDFINTLYLNPPRSDAEIISEAIGEDRLNDILHICQFVSLALSVLWVALNLTYFTNVTNDGQFEMEAKIFILTQSVAIVISAIQGFLMTFEKSLLHHLDLSSTS